MGREGRHKYKKNNSVGKVDRKRKGKKGEKGKRINGAK